MVIIQHDKTNATYVTFFTHEALGRLRDKHNLAISPAYPMLDESKAITHWVAERSAIDYLINNLPDTFVGLSHVKVVGA